MVNFINEINNFSINCIEKINDFCDEYVNRIIEIEKLMKYCIGRINHTILNRIYERHSFNIQFKDDYFSFELFIILKNNSSICFSIDSNNLDVFTARLYRNLIPGKDISYRAETSIMLDKDKIIHWTNERLKEAERENGQDIQT